MESKTGNIFFERISVFGNESFFSEYATGFRFGFNGKEKTDELYGTGNAYDYGMRMYDARLGRPLSTDPLFKKFPELSPYQFFSDSPIEFIDLDGKEKYYPLNGGNGETAKLSLGDKFIVFGNITEKVGYAGMGLGGGITLFSGGTLVEFGAPIFAGGDIAVGVGGFSKGVGEYLNGNISEARTDIAFAITGLVVGGEAKALGKVLTPGFEKASVEVVRLSFESIVAVSQYGIEKTIENKNTQSDVSGTKTTTGTTGTTTTTTTNTIDHTVLTLKDNTKNTTNSAGRSNAVSSSGTSTQTRGYKTPGFANGIQGAPASSGTHSGNKEITP
ncbi:MAG TPA: RHS repeat-associated core domain-containing protein [Bacteroidia bacterium]|nr:RHS repeat-associated core domain-containing protein [Bacteroidia bacterium]